MTAGTGKPLGQPARCRGGCPGRRRCIGTASEVTPGSRDATSQVFTGGRQANTAFDSGLDYCNPKLIGAVRDQCDHLRGEDGHSGLNESQLASPITAAIRGSLDPEATCIKPNPASNNAQRAPQGWPDRYPLKTVFWRIGPDAGPPWPSARRHYSAA